MKKLILLPIQLLFSNDYLKERGIRTVEEERIDIVFSYLKGKTMDIGCGAYNYLIKKYKNGIGIDITFYRNNDLCASAENLCFKDEIFETVVIMGTLDYFNNKEKALKEINRILKKEGQLILTTLNP
ncbi:MAG TPA: class I SAM-dependent methyltransferase, partial [bacterium]|nr:class I SAM-dependent methyltransferase [bacterium]